MEMMELLEKGDILTLSDNRDYIVVSIVEYNERNYCYLIDVNDNKNINFSKIINSDELEEITDNDLKMILIEKFNDSLN